MEKLLAALEISKIGVWEFNERRNSVYFSKSSKSIIGFEDDPAFGDSLDDWNDRVHPDDRKKYFQDYQDHINGLTPIYTNKHRIKCKNGSYKWILDKGKVINDHTTEGYIHFVGTHTDITDEIENEIKVANALTIATKQNNKLKNFAHIVTHNLKQYSGNFESLLEFYDEAESHSEKEDLIVHLKEVSAALNKTIQNLNHIVSVQSKKETHVEKLCVSEFVDSTLKLLDVVITESNATIINKINPKLYIYYNSAYLESIIQNLISNAIKYKHPERNPVVEITSQFSNGNIIFKFSDNGLGIDLKKFGKDIFELYKTFHHNEDAEGVGLYLIKNQIESFGGTISVASEVNVGTTFTIVIDNKKIK
ncbi:ATP-binding protein [Lacinutrix sp. Hel_I_90]|uniref:sensor histidine kinase n=1 Tax=Lacinutrix sp. Hel_I_90 TaxID=1249999 RepID=UPI001E423585|nr:PAS domain-containing sensor histidine kinase [Lacinutrix sp. Hel_I_90]